MFMNISNVSEHFERDASSAHNERTLLDVIDSPAQENGLVDALSGLPPVVSVISADAAEQASSAEHTQAGPQGALYRGFRAARCSRTHFVMVLTVMILQWEW